MISSVEKDYLEREILNGSRLTGGLILCKKEDLLKKTGRFLEVR